MKRTMLGLVLSYLAVFPTIQTPAEDLGQVVSNAWVRVREEGSRALLIGRIKAAFADRKDIPGRLIRVRLKGDVVQLAGFVPNREVAQAAEALAKELAGSQQVTGYWVEDPSVAVEETYKTHAGEQTVDAILKTKILVSLNSPAVTPQFKTAEILHVQVSQGAVVVYIVADETASFDLQPYVQPISGVVSCTTKVVEAF